jgi:hypothetical protein
LTSGGCFRSPHRAAGKRRVAGGRDGPCCSTSSTTWRFPARRPRRTGGADGDAAGGLEEAGGEGRCADDYDTTLGTLLGDLGIRRVIVTGIAGNICVLFTANDAYMRGLSIYAPADCIVSNTDDDNTHALRQIVIVLKGRTAPSARLTFSRAPAKRRQRR